MTDSRAVQVSTVMRNLGHDEPFGPSSCCPHVKQQAAGCRLNAMKSTGPLRVVILAPEFCSRSRSPSGGLRRRCRHARAHGNLHVDVLPELAEHFDEPVNREAL